MIQTADNPRKMRALWQSVFGDSDAYLDVYCQHMFADDRVLLYHQEEETVAMLVYAPITWVCGREQIPCGYLHAVATHPQHRNRGLSSILLQEAEKRLQEKGCRGSILVPAEKSLFGFYEKRGYQTGFYTKTVEIQREKGQRPLPVLVPTSLVAVQQQRNRYFSQGRAFAQWQQKELEFFDAECGFLGGAVLETSGAYLVCYPHRQPQETVLYIKEIACPPAMATPLIQAALQYFSADRGVVRFAATDPADSTPFGMIRWFSPEDRHRFLHQHREMPPYLSLAID